MAVHTQRVQGEMGKSEASASIIRNANDKQFIGRISGASANVKFAFE
jgi:hypothetical protein